MDFFREQDIARRNTRLLVVLFLIAVLVLILLTNLLVAGTLFYQDFANVTASSTPLLDRVNWRLFFGIGGTIAGVVGLVVLFNWLRFAQGGRVVAEALGGRPAVTGTTDPLERRALNIVAEMSLAANMPVPPLYILDDERGINAFAAGISPSDAVVAVTRGAMVQLTRDELQGVIGHEFSHILNGDMRLSIRLASMLRGITFIGDIGSILLHSAALHGPRRHRTQNGQGDARAVGLVLGLGLYVLGLLGGLMAGLIKSAISQQKEYLADASSVQFTRNPDGIGNALKVIGGYTPGTLVHTARAEELSHLFFGQVKHRMWSMFATHPPLPDRIRRVDPNWDGEYIQRAPNHEALEPHRFAQSGRDRAAREALMVSAATAATIDLLPSEAPDASGDSEPAGVSIPGQLSPAIVAQTRDPLSATAMVLALLWHPSDAQEKQLAAVRESNIRGLELLVAQLGNELLALSTEQRLPLLELCLPTLKQLSPAQYQQLKRLLMVFVKADGQILLSEWCLYQLVRHYLDPEFVQTKPAKPRYKNLEKVQSSLAVALGTLALNGDGDTDTAFRQGADILELPLTMPDIKALGVGEFSKAIHVLADCYPLLKVTILKAMVATAAHDGVVNPQELTLIKAIAAVIDCPLPDQMLPGADM
ncbi:MAG: M48 family metalloprotease [Halieaceae bacterium]|nr:M48 family metalloprotease [Halieaceae bacterium]